MPHKITLTGKPSTPPRFHRDFVTFDMEEGGSVHLPKDLPSSSTITYTLFVTDQQLTKAGIAKNDIEQTKLAVQGEPSLDIPIDLCPGEVGVIVYQLQAPEKQSQKDNAKQEAIKKHMPLPKGAQEWMAMDQVVVPEAFQELPPNPRKVQERKTYIYKHGAFDQPVTIDETGVIQDGYSRYVAAKELKFDQIPIRYLHT